MSPEITVQRCPFLDGPVANGGRGRVGELQCRLRADCRRAPSRDELAWFCTNGAFRACPNYREYRLERPPRWRAGAA